jgi:serine/threonine-protein kinase RIM15
MAGNDEDASRFLAPPAVTALKEDARTSEQRRASMERTFSEDIRAERDDLREAAEQTLNVIVDLGLDGRIKWVSPSWKQVVGSAPDLVEGKPISDILLTNKTVFQDAIESMKEDDARSRFVRFAVQMGPDSILNPSRDLSPQSNDDPIGENVVTEGAEDDTQEQPKEGTDDSDADVLNMEARGIMVYDRSADGEGHVS